MYRFFFPAAVSAALFLSACNPPARTIPNRIRSGLDSVPYTGIVEAGRLPDLRTAKFLAKVKVGDLGVSLDCTYADVLDIARAKARPAGGNLIVVTEHTRNQEKSKCHKIKGDIYAIGSLEGLEPQIWWNEARPLMRGDLLGKATAASPFPGACRISCRLRGDFFKEVVVCTETIFQADSCAASDNNFDLRRAQLHFNLAELHARRIKSTLLGFGADLPAISSKFRSVAAGQQLELRQQEAALEADLAGSDRENALSRWEKSTAEALQSTGNLWGEQHVDLRKKKK